MSKALEAPGAVGFTVCAAIGDEIVLADGYGLAEAEHGVKADRETIFRIGSITKQFTAAAIMLLYEQEQLELDADMRLYLDDFPTGEHVVTLRHLLTHTSGIKSYTGLGAKWMRTVPLELSHDQLVAMFADKPFDFPPGSTFRYNNSGYYLLGMLIEEVSGQSYADNIREQLFENASAQRLAGEIAGLVLAQVDQVASTDSGR